MPVNYSSKSEMFWLVKSRLSRGHRWVTRRDRGQGRRVSNFRSWRVAEICRICDEIGIDRPIVSQPYYNAMNRMPEVEHLPACGHYGLGVLPYSPLARGVLTGKYSPDVPPPQGTRAGRQDPRMMQTEWRTESLEIAQEIKRHAEKRGIKPGQFAVAWVLNNRLVTGVIAGPRTEEQWQNYLGALDYGFTAEDEALVVPGADRSPLDPGLQRSGLSNRGARAANGLTSLEVVWECRRNCMSPTYHWYP